MKRPNHYWRNLALFTLLVVMLGAITTGVGLAYLRAMGLVHPIRQHLIYTPSDVGVTQWEDVIFNSTDGLQLSGWFIPPDSKNRAAIIFVHGLGANRQAFLDQAAMLNTHGYGALLIDLRNHGKSQGTITTLGYLEVEDIRGAVQYLLTRSEVDPQRIGLMGHSMGAGTVIRAAARIPEVRFVITESAYTSLTDNITEGVRDLTGLPPFPFAPLLIWFGERETGVSMQQVRPIDDVPLIAPRPILFIHGQQDSTIPVRNSLQLYQAAHEPKQLYLVPNAGHVDLVEADPQEFERQVVGFLDKAMEDKK